MLKRFFLLGIVLAVAGAGLAALDSAAIEEADALYENDQPREAMEVLSEALNTANNGSERAEVFWRMSRATLDIGEQEEDRGGEPDPILAIYEEGEQYGIQAVEADPRNHLAYYWQSANIGKWGQVKGILNSLFKAGPMRDLLQQALEYEPEHADSYYVLGQMYEQVPGFISFGNKDYAVSLGRRSVDLHEADLASGEEDEMNHDFYIQLASHLIARDWDRGKRNREQRNKADEFEEAQNELEQGFFYEGVVDIPSQDDTEEAEEILREMIRSLESIDDRSDGQERQLDEARELLAGL